MAVDKLVDSSALDTSLGNIANAIRAKTGENGTMTMDEMPNKIAGIPTQKEEQSKTLTLGSSAPSAVYPDSGKVLSSVSPSIDTSVIKAENIKQGVTMLGIVGTHQGGISPSGTKSITENGTHDVTQYASASVSVPQAVPIEISTEEGMSAVLVAENVGKAYKFTGATGTYTNGDVYIVEAN